VADQYIQLPTDAANTGKKTDTSELSVGANTVQRQRANIASPATAAALAEVKAARPVIGEYGLAVREAPHVDGWSETHSPAVNTQATKSKAAGAAGVRHVCTGLSASLAGGTGATAGGTVTLNLRDGATGAGTVLMSWTVPVPAAGSINIITLSGVEIPGTAATAMTLEFSAAAGANTYESVNLTGHSASA
jgi:hypothetical protein